MPKAQDDDLVMTLVELASEPSPGYARRLCPHGLRRRHGIVQPGVGLRAMEPSHAGFPAGAAVSGVARASALSLEICWRTASGSCGKWRRAAWASFMRPGTKSWAAASRSSAPRADSASVCRRKCATRAKSAIPMCARFSRSTPRPPRGGEIDFLTMEFLDGETLAARLSRGKLPEAEARAIGRQICAGLAEAHRNRVVHGDLKSNNVILTRGRRRRECAR